MGSFFNVTTNDLEEEDTVSVSSEDSSSAFEVSEDLDDAFDSSAGGGDSGSWKSSPGPIFSTPAVGTLTRRSPGNSLVLGPRHPAQGGHL